MATGELAFDVVVMGAGVTGFAAASTLKEQGKRVAVLAKSSGATSVSSGAWDFGPLPSQGVESLTQLRASPRWSHLYQRILLEHSELAPEAEIKKTANFFEKHLQPSLELSFRFEKPYVLPTTGGLWKKTFGAQAIQVAADREQLHEKNCLVSGIHWRFSPKELATKLEAEARSHGVEVTLTPLLLRDDFVGPDCALPHVAVRLEADNRAKEVFLSGLKKSLPRGTKKLLLPPVILEEKFRRRMEETLGVSVGELLCTTEPTAGYRLHRAIQQGLRKQEIPFYKVDGIRPVHRDQKILELEFVLQATGVHRTIKGSHFVLATGKYFGGGIHLGYQRVKETVLDLPLFVERGAGRVNYRSELYWAEKQFQEQQKWAHLGVWCDSQWRPMDGSQKPIYTNLRACGSVLGGADYAREGLGLGFMAYSGRQCGLDLT